MQKQFAGEAEESFALNNTIYEPVISTHVAQETALGRDVGLKSLISQVSAFYISP